MKSTLLEMTQLILSAMDSDEVNSISDTVESQQVALLIKSVYYDLITDIAMPELETAFQLNASGTSAKPTLMTLPENAIRVRQVFYNTKLSTETYPKYEEVTYLPFVDFMIQQQSLREDTVGVGSMTVTFNGENYQIMYMSDKFPTFYTTLDDNTLLFDAYDSSEEATLQKSKTMCLGPVTPVFTMEDSFTPDLDPTQFSLLVNRAKVRAFKELKQQDNTEAAGEARRQKVIVQKRKRTINDLPEVYKNARYGRK